LWSKRVVAGAAIVLAFTPLATEITVMFEAVKSGIEGALLDHKFLAGDLLDAEENAVTMKFAE
jgi:hypothetical protein